MQTFLRTVDWIPGRMGKPLKHKVELLSSDVRVEECTTRAMTEEEKEKYGSIDLQSDKVIYHGDRRVRTFKQYR